MPEQKAKIALKRVYAEPAASDGTRVLVDRLWPRGFSKERAHVDIWLKEIAPSNELRKWFGHDPEKFDEFRERYKKELSSTEGKEALERLKDLLKQGDVTLVYGARDEEHNNAVVVREIV